MIYPFADRRPVPQLDPEIGRLSRLVADLERIRQGYHPDKSVLAEAPTIDHWSPAQRWTVALVGKVSDHPTIHDGRLVCTSDLWFVAPSLGYARTLNRFYALGRKSPISDLWGVQ